jgi:hypothetical protein
MSQQNPFIFPNLSFWSLLKQVPKQVLTQLSIFPAVTAGYLKNTMLPSANGTDVATSKVRKTVIG